MAYEGHPVKALLKSKSYQILLAWLGLLLGVAYASATDDQTVELLKSGSLVVSTFLIAEGIRGAMALYVKENDPK